MNNFLNPLLQFNAFMTTFYNTMPLFVRGFIAICFIGLIIRAILNIFSK